MYTFRKISLENNQLLSEYAKDLDDSLIYDDISNEMDPEKVKVETVDSNG